MIPDLLPLFRYSFSFAIWLVITFFSLKFNYSRQQIQE
jgi:hypothetical protein